MNLIWWRRFFILKYFLQRWLVNNISMKCYDYDPFISDFTWLIHDLICNKQAILNMYGRLKWDKIHEENNLTLPKCKEIFWTFCLFCKMKMSFIMHDSAKIAYVVLILLNQKIETFNIDGWMELETSNKNPRGSRFQTNRWLRNPPYFHF